MGKTRNTGYLGNIVLYDENDNITLPARLAVTGTVAVNNTTPYDTTQFSLDVNGGLIVKNVGKTAQIALINSNPAAGGNAGFVIHTVGGTSTSSYADIQGYYGTSIAGSTVIRLNPLGGNVLIGSLAGTGSRMVVADATGVLSTQAIVTLGDLSGVSTSRTLTINGTTYDLSANRTWTLSTSDIAEGINLYYTQTRFNTAFTAKSTSDLAEGTNLYYTTSRFDTRLATKSTTDLAEGTNLYYTDTRVGTYLTSNSYATQTYVNTAVSNLVDAAPGTLDTLNELAAALGDDPNFATTVATSIGTKEPAITAGTTSQYWRGDKTWQTLPVYTLSGLGGVPTTRSLTINGTAYDLSADRSWTINSMVYPGAGIPLSTGTAWGTSITNNSANWNTAYGWGNHASAGYLTGITSSQVTTALGYTPYNSTNPNGYISSYVETDTLATVTARGATTATNITLTGGGNTFNGHHYFSPYDANGNHYPHYNAGSNANGSKLNLRMFDNSGNAIVFHLNGSSKAIEWNGNTVYHSGNLTNLNQLTNGPGYITSSSLTSYLPLAGGTMTGIITFSATTGNKIDFYYSGNDRYGIQVQNSELRIHSGAEGAASGGITFGKSTGTVFTETLRVRNDGIVNVAGYLRTAGVSSNTILWSGGAESADFGNVLGQGSSTRSTFFKGAATSSVWWGGTDGLGNVIPFTAIDATSGEFAFWRNSGGVGGGSWTKIMTMNASGLTMNSGNFIGSLTGNASTATALSSMNISQFTNNSGYLTSLYGWTNSPDSWYGIGQSTSASGATAVGGHYPWTLSYHTGLALSAHSAYGGIRFYNQNYPTGPLASAPVLQIINGGMQANGSIVMNGNDISGLGTLTSTNYYQNSNGYFQFGFTNTNTAQWPLVRFGPSDVPGGWDEGIIKASTSEGVFGRYGMGIHMHSSRGFGIYSTGWNKIIGFKSDGVQSFVNLIVPTLNGFSIAQSDQGTTSLHSKIPAFSSTGNLSTVNPESYSGEVRLGAAWSRGGVYASSTLSMSTSSGNINFVSNDTVIGGFRWDSSNGTRFIVGLDGNIQTPYTLVDANKRPVVYARGAYPVLVLDHTETSNTNHGPTIQFAFNGLDSRQWVIGASGNGSRLDFGMSNTAYSNTNYNPHNGIAGYQGKTIMRMTETGVVIGSLGTYPTIESPAYPLDVRGSMRVTSSIESSGNIWAYSGIQMYRNGQANTGISWYNGSYYNWQEYMASAGTGGCGPNGNLTAPSGLYQVTAWALRSRMEGVGSYGWLWEVSGGGGGSATASSVMELDVYGNLRLSSDVVAYASDVRLKTNIKVIENAITKVQAIRGVEYDWLDNIYEDYGFKPTKMHEVGVIAQEVESVLPEVVLTAPFNGAYKDKHGTDPNFLTVKYERIVPLLIEAIKEQQAQIESQKTEIEELKDLVKQLINR